MKFPRSVRLLFLLAVTAAETGTAAEPSVHLTVEVDKPGVAVSPVMHGVFFEDINYSADGGLYAELVQNRSFEHKDQLYSWSIVNHEGTGQATIETTKPLNPKNTHYLRLQVPNSGKGFGVANSGFDGIAVKKGENYLFSVHARGDLKGPLLVRLEDEKGQSLGECQLKEISSDWKQLTGSIQSSETAANAKLVVLAMGNGEVDLDMISLFPENTWNKRRNGLRADLVKMLADLHPGFMRFPGGCIVEGKDLANAYRWKDTIGDVAERPENWNRWQSAIKTAAAPEYYQTYGLGFFEYFQLCEDIGAEPVPILNCGMSCQFQDAQLVPLDKLGPYVQDALDLVEFANGPTTSTWGAKRAAMGHPEPFHLRYMGVGNEQWGDQYFERYPIFYKALKEKYPDIKLITTAGPGVDGGEYARWKLAWDKFKTLPADIVDEHYYRPPQWFLDKSNRYDGYDRKGPKVFAGEFAAHDKNRRNNLKAALAEAAFMTGLLRDADVVVMASYAPLFAKENRVQWWPNLIWFDNTQVYGTPSYYVQMMYGRNLPDVVLPSSIEKGDDGRQSDAQKAARPLYVTAGQDRKSGETILKVVNVTDQPVGTTIDLRGAKKVAPEMKEMVLTAQTTEDENSLANPTKVMPKQGTEKTQGSSFSYQFRANSFTVLRVKTE
jgi:alpha-N-arabinofuranosidase